MPGRRHAVEPHGVNIRVCLGLAAQVPHQVSRGGKSVGLGVEGQNHEGAGVPLLDMGGGFMEVLVAAVGLEEEVPDPQLQEPVRYKTVFPQHVPAVLDLDGADGGKDIGFIPGCSPGHLTGRADQSAAVRLGHPQPVDGVGVGLDGPAARLQISPVNGLNFTGVGDAGPLAGVGRGVVPFGVVGAHAAVKQQRLFFQILPDVLHLLFRLPSQPSTVRAISALCLASFA